MRPWPFVVSLLTVIDLRVMAEKTYGAAYKKNVMFLCNHNSCRSQMADGWLRALRGDRPVGVASAGIVGGTAVKPGAIAVMKESGVDISGFTSDAVADFDPNDFDVVVSCCGCGAKLDPPDKAAWKTRAVFADWNLDDPPAIDPGDLSAYAPPPGVRPRSPPELSAAQVPPRPRRGQGSVRGAPRGPRGDGLLRRRDGA